MCLQQKLFRDTVLPLVTTVMRDFSDWLKSVSEDTSLVNLSGYDQKIREQLQLNLVMKEFDRLKTETIKLRDLCSNIFDLLPFFMQSRYVLWRSDTKVMVR